MQQYRQNGSKGAFHLGKSTGYEQRPAYRTEIDGLRAIAVLAVVLYHFSVPSFGGGLVGVDIFFVISGFLIGGILMREQDRFGRIALGRFYLRRIRRLAPAYMVMAGGTFLAAYFILLPFEFREFGKELIASTTYLANIHFYRETGYFDIGVENRILLHNWSLAVEEQFYIFLPFLILLFTFSRRALQAALVILFAASLISSVWLTTSNQSAAFYLFPFRAWELLAGVLLAYWTAGRAPPDKAWLSWVGMALMLGSIVLVQPGPAFPGWQVIVPVTGTVLMLAGGQHVNPVTRALSSPVPVFFGRISYSFYLWHWPVLTLSMYWRGGYSGPLEAAFWLVLSFVLSVLTWRFVEHPARISQRLTSAKVLIGWVVGSVILVVAGGVVFLKDGAPGRFAPEVRTHIEASADFLQDWSRCHVPESGPFTGVEICPIGPEGKAQVLIWGDSHLRPLREGLALAAREANTPALLVWNAGCPPFFGVSKVENTTSPAEDRACSRANATIRAAVQSGQVPPRLLLVGRWSYYAEGVGVGLDAHNTITLTATEGAALAATSQPAIYAAAFGETLANLAGVFDQVHVLRQMPEIPAYDSRLIARETAHGRLDAVGALERASVELNTAMARAAQGAAPLLAAKAAGHITLLDPWPHFCNATTCSAMPEGRALYFDNNHITNSAGLALRALFAPVLTGGGP